MCILKFEKHWPREHCVGCPPTCVSELNSFLPLSLLSMTLQRTFQLFLTLCGSLSAWNAFLETILSENQPLPP